MRLASWSILFVLASAASLTHRARPESCVRGSYYLDGETAARSPESAWGACAGYVVCPAGSYCTADGVRRPCPPGTRGGNRTGLEDEACAGLCRAGYYCPSGTPGDGFACGAAPAYCPEGSSEPSVAGPGEFTVPADAAEGVRGGGGSHQTAALTCPPGSYCPGDGTAQLCPGGTFGLGEGLRSANCSGQCSAGFYCPAGSTSATAIACGHARPAAEQANVHCPASSRQPVPTRRGFYALRAGSLSVGTRNHVRDGVGAYVGNINTLALSFNWTCALPPSQGKRAALKAALAALLGLDEASEMGRFTVTRLRAASSTEAGYAAQASALARYLALSSGATAAAVERAAADAQELADADAAAANGTTTEASATSPSAANSVESAVWAVRFEVTGSSDARLKHAASSAQAWRDELLQTLKAPAASDALREALGHLPGTLPGNRTDNGGSGGHSGVIDSSDVGVRGYSNGARSGGGNSNGLQGGAPYGSDAFAVVDPASVRGVVAAYRPRAAAWTTADPTAPTPKDVLLTPQDPSAVHHAVPLAVSFNISAQVPSLSDADCVLTLAQRKALREAILEALGVGNIDGDVTQVTVQNFGVTTAARARQHYQAPGLERGGKGGWRIAVVWAVALHVAVPSAVLQFDDGHARAAASFVQAADNDVPGPLGWRGGAREALPSPIFARHDGVQEREEFSTLVDPMERWAATVRNALSGPQFQLACERILASQAAAASTSSAAAGTAAAAGHPRATQVEVVNESVRAQSAASFGWADGWPPGYLVDDVDGKPFYFLDEDDSDYGDADDKDGALAGPHPRHHMTYATSAAGWASEVYHTGGFAVEKPCEPGFWCEHGIRHRCPAGRYGARAQSTDSTCDGPCAAGYYCPAGSASPLAHACSSKGGNPNVYCPAGSGAPVAVPRGYYSYGDGGGTKTFAKPFNEVDANHDGVLDWLEFSASGPVLEAAHAAAAASSSSPSSSSSSSRGAALELRGGALGVTSRTTVTVVPGVYGAVPAETYSKISGSSRDNDEEEKGVLEHALRHEARALWEHADRDTSGELDPREYYQGVVSVVGAWGAAYETANGRLLASSSNAFRVDQDAKPEGTADGNPFLKVLPANSTRLGDARFSLAASETRSFASPCEPGFYCSHGVRYPCPRGTWGASPMLDHPSCDGPCAPGYWCPEQSTSPYGESSTTLPPRLDAHECGNASVFCATGSKAPQRVFVGYYTLGGDDHGRTRSSERRCTPGSYCSGDGIRRPCSMGFYGAGWGHTDRKCSGLCAAGFYCPVGSTKAEAFPCGDPDVICPEGSSAPIPVAKGTYSVNGVCSDRWPPRLRSEIVFHLASLRANEVVWTADELQPVLEDPAWSAQVVWTLQATVTSTCSHPLTFGFGGGRGTLRVVVPGNAQGLTLRVHDTVDASFVTVTGAAHLSKKSANTDTGATGTGKAGAFVAFDRCNDVVSDDQEDDNATASTTASFSSSSSSSTTTTSDEAKAHVTFHEMRLGVGKCPGFASAPLGACLEARWEEVTTFEAPGNAEAFRNEDTSVPRSAVVKYLARSVNLRAPSIASPPNLRFDASAVVTPLPNGAIHLPPDFLANKTWLPCDFSSYEDENPNESKGLGKGEGAASASSSASSTSSFNVSTDGLAAGRRLLYDDGPLSVWARQEPVWWRRAFEAGQVRATPSVRLAPNPALAWSWPSAAWALAPWSTYAFSSPSSSTSSSASDFPPEEHLFLGSDTQDGFVDLASVAARENTLITKASSATARAVADFGGVTAGLPGGVVLPSPRGESSGDRNSAESAESAMGAFRATGGVARRTAESLAPPGHYALRGLLYECPAGTYGATSGLSSPQCSGQCERGFYCPPSSVHPRQIPCGSPRRFCPPGSPFPLPVSAGFYTSTVDADACPPGTWRNGSGAVDPTLTEEAFTPDATGWLKSAVFGPTVVHLESWGGDVNDFGNAYSSEGLGDGGGDGWAIGPTAPCVPCPLGTFKPLQGDALSQCRACDLYTAVSTNDRIECACNGRAPGRQPLHEGAEALVFDASTGACVSTLVANLTSDEAPRQLVNSSATRFAQHPCERGFWCASSGVRYPCPAGRFGSSLYATPTEPPCEGACAPGYFCPEGSTSSTQFACGAADRFCPEGSATPRLVQPGWYTNEDRHVSVRSSETICPPGHWCAGGLRYACPAGTWLGESGAIDASACQPCEAGYWCPEASVSPRPNKCGNATVFCPTGSALPQPVVPEGFYATHAGSPYQGAAALRDPHNTTCSAQLLCEPGYWCRDGIKYQCPAGRFGWARGSSSPDCGGVCAAGYRCPGHPGTPSLTAKPLECAPAEAADPSSYYCPAGSANAAKRATAGHYTVGGGAGNRTRTNQVRCEVGWWCRGGVKAPCPVGSYGRTRGLTTSRCSGVCPAGFACPEASVEPTKCQPGSYSTGAAKRCTRCPGGDSEYATVYNPERKQQSCVNSRSCCGY